MSVDKVGQSAFRTSISVFYRTRVYPMH